MRVDYLLHQTNIEYLRSILTHGLKFSLKSKRIIESDGDLERFIWFDFIGRVQTDIVYSNTGFDTASKTGITIVLDFDKILTKVRQRGDGFSLKFLSDYVRFEPDTRSITLWDSTVDSEDNIPDKVSRSVECVIATDYLDKTLNQYLYNKSDRDEIHFKITDCISKFVVCPAEEQKLNTLLRMLGLGKIPVVVHRGLAESDMRSIIQTHCPGHSAELCEMLYVEAFISNCVS
jgi:hypothetical protein